MKKKMNRKIRIKKKCKMDMKKLKKTKAKRKRKRKIKWLTKKMKKMKNNKTIIHRNLKTYPSTKMAVTSSSKFH